MALRTWAADVLDADRRPFAPEDVSGRRRRFRRTAWIIGIIVVVLCAATVGFLANDEVQANDHFDRVRASLEVTQRNIATENQELATARRQLALVTAQVGSDSTALAQDQSQLQAAQSALAAALAHVSQQTTQIGSLHTCLRGVEKALNALAVNQQASAISALTAVGTSCTQATASE